MFIWKAVAIKFGGILYILAMRISNGKLCTVKIVMLMVTPQLLQYFMKWIWTSSYYVVGKSGIQNWGEVHKSIYNSCINEEKEESRTTTQKQIMSRNTLEWYF